MNVSSLVIQGFRSFRKPQTLHFRGGPGLYLLGGKNELEPELGANGAGKSSVFDALTWVLYGKTTRGLKGPSVVSRDTDELCRVSIEFELGDDTWTLRRTQAPNTLTLQKEMIRGGDQALEPKVVTQAQVDKLLGVPYEVFLQAVVVGQFADHFADMKPAAKQELLVDVLDLDVWTRASEKARDDGREAADDVTRWSAKIDGLHSTIASLEAGLKESRTAHRDFDKVRDGQLDDLEAEHEQVEEELDEAGLALDKAKASSAKLKSPSKLRASLEALEEEETGMEQESRSHQRKVARAKERELAASRDFRCYEAAGGKTCPSCGQATDPKEIEAAMEEAEKVRLEWIESGQGDQKQVDKFEAQLAKIAPRIAKLRDQIRDHKLSETKLTMEQGAAQRSVDTKEKRLDRIAKRHDELDASENPHGPAIERAEKGIAEAQMAASAAEDQVAEARRIRDQGEFWSKGFKGVRLWAIRSALDELEITTNNALRALGLADWVVSFDTEKVTGSGKISKGFTMTVTSPTTEDPVPWEAWSGGESQRIRLAVQAGLADLVRSRYDFRPNLEAWDEPTAHLGQDGVGDLLDYLAGRGRHGSRQVWIIDHRSLSAGAFVEQHVVVKGEKGSELRIADNLE